ncbi:MAG: IS630 transposase-related protein [Nitrososphaerota archaeon]|nr:IS630 transposase-related protein [Nitrososphaerota archaeon]
MWSKCQKQGHYQPEPLNCGRKPKINKTTMNKVIEKIQEQPDITLQELIDEIKLPINQSALCRRLRKLDLTFKKKTLPPSKQTKNSKSNRSAHSVSQSSTGIKRVKHLLA